MAEDQRNKKRDKVRSLLRGSPTSGLDRALQQFPDLLTPDPLEFNQLESLLPEFPGVPDGASAAPGPSLPGGGVDTLPGLTVTGSPPFEEIIKLMPIAEDLGIQPSPILGPPPPDPFAGINFAGENIGDFAGPQPTFTNTIQNILAGDTPFDRGTGERLPGGIEGILDQIPSATQALDPLNVPIDNLATLHPALVAQIQSEFEGNKLPFIGGNTLVGPNATAQDRTALEVGSREGIAGALENIVGTPPSETNPVFDFLFGNPEFNRQQATARAGLQQGIQAKSLLNQRLEGTPAPQPTVGALKAQQAALLAKPNRTAREDQILEGLNVALGTTELPGSTKDRQAKADAAIAESNAEFQTPLKLIDVGLKNLELNQAKRDQDFDIKTGQLRIDKLREQINNLKDQIRSRGIRDKSGEEALALSEQRLALAEESHKFGIAKNNFNNVLGVLGLVEANDLTLDQYKLIEPLLNDMLSGIGISFKENTDLASFLGFSPDVIAEIKKKEGIKDGPQTKEKPTEADDIINKALGN